MILDAGAISALARGDVVARATLSRARRGGRLVVIPAPVLVEVHTGGHDHARIDRVINAVDEILDTTPDRARAAGLLRARSGIAGVVDAIVVAEAVAATSAVIVTSDPGDVQALVDAAEATTRIVVIGV